MKAVQAQDIFFSQNFPGSNLFLTSLSLRLCRVFLDTFGFDWEYEFSNPVNELQIIKEKTVVLLFMSLHVFVSICKIEFSWNSKTKLKILKSYFYLFL